MSDRENLLALLKKIDANFKETAGISGHHKIRVDNSGSAESEFKIGGYDYFYSEWVFDEAGNLLRISHWE